MSNIYVKTQEEFEATLAWIKEHPDESFTIVLAPGKFVLPDEPLPSGVTIEGSHD